MKYNIEHAFFELLGAVKTASNLSDLRVVAKDIMNRLQVTK